MAPCKPSGRGSSHLPSLSHLQKIGRRWQLAGGDQIILLSDQVGSQKAAQINEDT